MAPKMTILSQNIFFVKSYSYVLLTHFLQERQRVRVRDGLVLVLVLVVNANTLYYTQVLCEFCVPKNSFHMLPRVLKASSESLAIAF